jgi:hypothetical protein
MERNLDPELSKEELREICFGLLREWWIAATQALVDEAGTEAALRYLKPYFINTGVAGAHNLQSLLGVSAEELLRLEIIHHLWKMMTGGRQRVFRAEDGSTIYETVDCATGGICREGCMSFCDFMANAYYGELSPALELISHRALSWGDAICQGLLRNCGQKAKVDATDEFLVPEDELPVPMEEEFREYMALSVMGEAWSNATRALVDYAGQERAYDRLRFHMRHSGLSFGIRMSDRFGARERGLDSILEMIELVQILHHRKATYVRGEEGAEGKVNECPFSSSSPEICAQYEAFCNGICEAVDPDYEFAYDRMMSKGEGTCSWDVRRRAQEGAGSEKENASEQLDAQKMLKRRLAAGEISKEEYRELRDLLREK